MQAETVVVPVATVESWKRQIAELMAEVNHHGLNLSATIGHPSQDPAILYGKPLAFTCTQQVIEELARHARSPSHTVSHAVKVDAGGRYVVEIEAISHVALPHFGTTPEPQPVGTHKGTPPDPAPL